jgi:hypothetical protein
MTLKQIAIKEFGKLGFEKLDARVKKVIKNVDALNKNQKPVPRRLMEKALS